jgi:hypothetical protein
VWAGGSPLSHRTILARCITAALAPCCRGVVAGPIERARRMPQGQMPYESVPAIPPRRACSGFNSAVDWRCRFASSASCCSWGRLVQVRRTRQARHAGHTTRGDSRLAARGKEVRNVLIAEARAELIREPSRRLAVGDARLGHTRGLGGHSILGTGVSRHLNTGPIGAAHAHISRLTERTPMGRMAHHAYSCLGCVLKHHVVSTTASALSVRPYTGRSAEGSRSEQEPLAQQVEPGTPKQGAR